MILRCQQENCEGTGIFFLSDGEVEWYHDMGLDLPRACPDCRDWRDDQADDYFQCESCGTQFFVPRNLPIGWHRYKSDFHSLFPPQQCFFCRTHPEHAEAFRLMRDTEADVMERLRRAHGEPITLVKREVIQGQSRSTGARPLQLHEFALAWNMLRQMSGHLTTPEGVAPARRSYLPADIRDQVVVTPLRLVTDPEYYKSEPHHKEGTRYGHIFGDDSQVQQLGPRHRLELAGRLGLDPQPHIILERLGAIAASTNPGDVWEFRDLAGRSTTFPDGPLIKYHVPTGVCMVIDDRTSAPTLITAYALKNRERGVMARICGTAGGPEKAWVPNLRKPGV